MADVKVGPERMAEAIAAELQAYANLTAEDCKTAVRDVAKDCVRDIKDNIRKAGIRARADGYLRGWKASVTSESLTELMVTVHNDGFAYLTHLLEHGHMIVMHGKMTGKRTRAFPHIAPAERAAAERLEKRVKVVVED